MFQSYLQEHYLIDLLIEEKRYIYLPSFLQDLSYERQRNKSGDTRTKRKKYKGKN